jgi:hypothetical protein
MLTQSLPGPGLDVGKKAGIEDNDRPFSFTVNLPPEKVILLLS